MQITSAMKMVSAAMAAETIFMADVICMVEPTELMRLRISFRLAIES
jgi:hypothetical protein